MPKIEIQFSYSEAGRRNRLLAGFPADHVGFIELTPESPDWQRAVELADLSGNGDGEIRLNYSNREYVQWDREPTVAELLDNAAAIRAARQKNIDDEIAATEAADARALAGKLTIPTNSLGEVKWDSGDGWRVLNYAKGQEHRLVTRNSPEWAAWMAEIEAHNIAVREAAAKAEAAKKAEAEAARKAELETLAAWTREHGSELARLRLEDGYDCWVSQARKDYADAVAEKVAEGSGLPLDDGDLYERCGSVKTEDRKCPTVEEIKALRSVKSALPDNCEAKIVWSRYTGGDLDEDTGRAEIEVSIPVPGAGEEKRSLVISE